MIDGVGQLASQPSVLLIQQLVLLIQLLHFQRAARDRKQSADSDRFYLFVICHLLLLLFLNNCKLENIEILAFCSNQEYF